MSDFLEDDQYLDNVEPSEELEDEPEPSDNSDGDPPRKGYVPYSALKEEREARKQHAAELQQLRQQMDRQAALLNQLGTPRQDPAQVRQTLQERMFDRPDEVLQEQAQYLERQMVQRIAPMAVTSAQNYLASHPQYKEIYTIPEIKQAIDGHILNQANAYGSVNVQELEGSLAGLRTLAEKLGGKTGGIADSGKSRLSSTVTKTPGGSKTQMSDEEVYRQALLNKPYKEYSAWEKDPKNQALINRVLFKK